jgi:hypothetical protein
MSLESVQREGRKALFCQGASRVKASGGPLSLRASGRAARTNPGEEAKADLAPILARMRAEFHEMPGLRLTFRQAQRLWNLDEASCRRALDVLVDSGFLARFATGTVGLPPIV